MRPTFGRWSVLREFNRRHEAPLRGAGIEIFNPLQSIAWTPPGRDQPHRRPPGMRPQGGRRISAAGD